MSHRMNDFVVVVVDAATLTCTMPDVQDQMPADMVLFILFVRYKTTLITFVLPPFLVCLSKPDLLVCIFCDCENLPQVFLLDIPA